MSVNTSVNNLIDRLSVKVNFKPILRNTNAEFSGPSMITVQCGKKKKTFFFTMLENTTKHLSQESVCNIKRKEKFQVTLANKYITWQKLKYYNV